MKYHFRVHREKSGFWAEGLELPHCQSQGDTQSELVENLKDALDLLLSEPMDSDLLFPLPQPSPKGKDILAIPVSPQVAIAASIKRLRLSKGLSQQKMKEALGIKSLWVYQKLENPRTSNPQFKTLVKIKQAFPDFDLDQIAA
ncbi:MAG: type II toxin-antitoxin system HicB family antitoxin [Bdellovibrionaceae bacterium]|nr:type II toxin-antitoxin system HicB family antitoxin [Pseudobdellovibrionaceae bacterium]